ncbi:Serine carboxypeptidase-like 12 [Acorus calamus]|uniref:Serine carboxypeptidase-like 12 n=1 Tax=Acorus calamus TaxID=4465 RepID=A0AAV9DJH3_ACOCL|nr:Serine carboxypeptidase-like 12 [Acorus calamus]
MVLSPSIWRRYIRVDEERDAQIFYYFIKAERNPDEDPLMLWISGGPGCSALTGLAFGIGMFPVCLSQFVMEKDQISSEAPTLSLFNICAMNFFFFFSFLLCTYVSTFNVASCPLVRFLGIR